MKKLVLAVAVIMSVSSLVFAQPNLFASLTETEGIEVMQEDSFKEVNLTDLNEKVQAEVNGYDESYTVKKLEYSDSQKQTRVTLVDKSTQAEKVVILDDEGKEVK